MIVARRPPEMTGQPRPRCGVGTASPMIVLRLRSSEVLAPQLATGSSGRPKGGTVRPPRWRSPAPRSTPEASATSRRNARDQQQRRDRTRHRHQGQGLQRHLVHRGVPEQRAAPGDLHPGRRTRRRRRARGLLPQSPGREHKRRRGGQAAAEVAPGRLTSGDPSQVSRTQGDTADQQGPLAGPCTRAARGACPRRRGRLLPPRPRWGWPEQPNPARVSAPSTSRPTSEQKRAGSVPGRRRRAG